MDKSLRDKLLLEKIVSQILAIQQFSENIDFCTFEQNEMIQKAIYMSFIIIGESANRLSEETTEKYPDTPWPTIVAFRNIIAHDYFGLDHSIAWDSIKIDIPLLFAQINKILGK